MYGIYLTTDILEHFQGPALHYCCHAEMFGWGKFFLHTLKYCTNTPLILGEH